MKKVLHILTAVLFLLNASLVHAQPPDPNELPTGGQIIGGSGQISSSGNQMTVNQNTDRMIAEWSTFNIGQNAAVQFIQPGASSVALNRILDVAPSQIFGKLSANGQVFLLNSAGIIFGPSAQVNVGALVASSLNITNEDFMAGRYSFGANGAAGPVVNQGHIRASDGMYVALISPNARNEGTIEAPRGSVLMAAGDKVNIDFDGDGLINYTVDKGAVDALAENKGLIKADGGLAVMTAKAADELTSAVVNNEGVIEARTLQEKKGRILLLAEGENSTTVVGGTLDASAPDGGDGGFIETSANNISYLDDFKVTAGAPFGKGGLWFIDPSDSTITQVIADGYATTLNTGTDVLNAVTGNITMNNGVHVHKTAGGDATFTLKASGNIMMSGNNEITSTVGRLNTVLWADSDGSGSGCIFFTTGTNSISSNGGGIWMGGGSGSTSWTPYSGASAITVGDSYAVGDSTLDGGRYHGGVEMRNSTSLTSGGGNITLRGKSYNASDNGTNGIVWDGGAIDAGAGKIVMDGVSRGSGSVNSQAVSMAVAVSIKSSNSETDAITITGDASGTTAGAASIGINMPSGVGNVIQNTGGGGIALTGISGTATYSAGFQMNSANVLANSGPISLTGRYATGSAFNCGSGFTIGKKAGTDVTSSSSNITFQGNSISTAFAATDIFSSSGTLTIAPYTAGTTIGIAGGAGTLSIAAARFGDSFANGFSKIVIGSAAAGSITVGTSALTYNDPLTLKTAGDITLSASSSVSGGAGSNALALWSDADVSNNGAINVSTATITTNGGNLTMAGGADDGTGQPGGYAWGNATNVDGVILYKTNCTTGGGNMVVRGQTAQAAGLGFRFSGDEVSSFAINTGSGNFTAAGTATAGYGIFSGKLTSLTTTSGNVSFNGTSTSSMGIMLQGNGATDTVSTGTGSISVTGSGSAATYGGIYVENAKLLSSSGDITLDGTNSNGSGWGIKLDAGSDTGTVLGHKAGGSSSSNITLKADTLNIARGTIDSSGALNIQPKTAGTSIGIAGGAGTLAVSAANFSTQFADGFSGITIGKSDAGAITVGGAVTFRDSTTLQNNSTIAVNGAITANENLALVSAGAITQSAAIGVTGTTDITAGATNNITLTNSSNNFTGGVRVVSGNDVSLRDTNALVMGNANGASTVSGNLTVQSGGAITQGGAYSVTGTTGITAGANDVTLTNTSNDFGGAVTVVSAKNLSLIDSNAMSLGAITSTGTVDIATLANDLTLTGAINTTDATANAVKLNAGKNTAAGTATGGNIIISGGTVTVGVGGQGNLYSGSVSGSTGLTNYIGSGSGRFRYNSDEVTTNYVTALTAGNNAIYREQPAYAVTANNASYIYTGTPYSGGNGYAASGLVNGDTAAAAFNGTVTYSGSSQGATAAGTYTITPGGLTSLLGYGLSYVSGTLTITSPTNQNNTGTSMSAAVSSVYNNTASIYSIQQTVNGTQDVMSVFGNEQTESQQMTGMHNIGPLTGSDTIGSAASGRLVIDRTVQ